MRVGGWRVKIWVKHALDARNEKRQTRVGTHLGEPAFHFHLEVAQEVRPDLRRTHRKQEAIVKTLSVTALVLSVGDSGLEVRGFGASGLRGSVGVRG